MTLDTSTLDAVDRAFLWHADQARHRLPHPVRARLATRPESQQPTCPEESLSRDAARARAPSAAVSIADSAAVPEPAPVPILAADEGTLVDRLLRATPDAWNDLATRVEGARRDGAEVIAITGARRGEGRTTVVACLARALAARGQPVECHDRVPLTLSMPGRNGRHGGGIVLVDAGVWFPGGPLRRAWLERQSLGCHAAILVRRADQPECAARGAALEAIGLTVLGEVLTMTPMTPPVSRGMQRHLGE
jgi:hypothetical protein